MYKTKLLIEKLSENISIEINFGIYSRPSTAQRIVKGLEAYNENINFKLTFEKNERRNEKESITND